MPPARASWKGQIRLSLVSLPVELFPATRSSAKIAFNQIHQPTGKRIRYEKVVDGVGPVDRDEIMKGFEYEKGNYVLLSDDEIDEVKLESRKTFELTQFVHVCDIDPIYFDRPFFVVPTDDLAEDAFRVVRDALRETQMAGLGQLALRGREYIGALKASGAGMVLETLRYAEEIRKAAPYFSSIGNEKTDPDMLSLAKELIERKTAPFDPSAFKDHYTDALRELIDTKLRSRGRKVEVAADEPRPQGTNVVDLMAALKQSIEKAPSGAAAKSVHAHAPARRSPYPFHGPRSRRSTAAMSSRSANGTSARRPPRPRLGGATLTSRSRSPKRAETGSPRSRLCPQSVSRKAMTFSRSSSFFRPGKAILFFGI